MFCPTLRYATRRPAVFPLPLGPTNRSSSNPTAQCFSRAFFSRITFTGNIGVEPNVTVNSSTGRECIRYVVASPYGSRENRRTSWFRVTSFATGPTRDYLLGIAKGSHVFVEGDISLAHYEDADGKKIPLVNIFERNIEVLRRSNRDFDGQPVEVTGEGQLTERQQNQLQHQKQQLQQIQQAQREQHQQQHQQQQQQQQPDATQTE